MKIYKTHGRRVFEIFNYLFVGIAALSCLLPFINMLAISFSSGVAASAGSVSLWPVDFTLNAYILVIQSKAFLTAMLVSFKRVILGTVINLIMVVITAYPLSKEKANFKARGVYAWFFLITMLFGGGLIPWYIVVKSVGLIDNIWGLVLPGALPVFSMIVVMNFFRGLPKELEEAAFIDGANHWTTLCQIYVPLSRPSLATITLFCLVSHWNSWFDGLILMNTTSKYPLQSYLQTVIINPTVFLKSLQTSNARNIIAMLGKINSQTSKAAQLVIATIPVLIAYPFLQKHFTAGLVVGSVKG